MLQGLILSPILLNIYMQPPWEPGNFKCIVNMLLTHNSIFCFQEHLSDPGVAVSSLCPCLDSVTRPDVSKKLRINLDMIEEWIIGEVGERENMTYRHTG